MERFHGYHALAELTLPMGDHLAEITIGPWQHDYRAFSYTSRQSWMVRFKVGAGLQLRAGVTAEVPLQVQPSDDAVKIFPYMEFELRENGLPVVHGRITRCWIDCTDNFGVRTLMRTAFLTEAMPLLRRVARVPAEPHEGGVEGSIARPFQPDVRERGILDCATPFFHPEECHALVTAARAIGETGLYLWVHEAGLTDRALQSDPACHFPLNGPADEEAFLRYYEVNTPPIGNSLFSATGRWGAIAYGNADHAVLGGPMGFVATVYAALGTNADEQALTFLRGYEGGEWTRDHSRYPWVPRLLAHLYGDVTAQRYIATANLGAADEPASPPTG